MTETAELMSEDEFVDQFDTIEAPSGETLWSFSEMKAAIDAGTIVLAQVWTVIDGDEDGRMYVVAGVHFVNRVDFVVTDQHWSDETDQAIWFDPQGLS